MPIRSFSLDNGRVPTKPGAGRGSLALGLGLLATTLAAAPTAFREPEHLRQYGQRSLARSTTDHTEHASLVVRTGKGAST